VCLILFWIELQQIQQKQLTLATEINKLNELKSTNTLLIPVTFTADKIIFIESTVETVDQGLNITA